MIKSSETEVNLSFSNLHANSVTSPPFRHPAIEKTIQPAPIGVSKIADALRPCLKPIIRPGADCEQAGARVVRTLPLGDFGSQGEHMKKTLAVLFTAAAFTFVGCDNRDNELVEENKDAAQESIDQQKEMVDDATRQAKENAEQGAEATKEQLDAQQEAAKAQLDAQKKNVEANAEAQKEINDAQRKVEVEVDK
ncbi:MAG TPA: hypothetical protein VF773_02435 [Verrucomicrobiae bacterium]